ncbi:MAG: hypothetical protein NTZ56_06390 [Acidobacteria bacterium]|nr:hypothetical protein [Acidobacteriota bacterium]
MSLTLQDVTATEATYGAEIGYVLAIKNTGPKAIEFPWSGEPDDGETPRPIDLSVFLTLVWAGPGDDLSIRTESVWGSKQVRNSIKLLQPGQEVLIRRKGSIQMAMSDAAGALVNSLPQRGTLKARLRFAKGAPVRAPLPLASDNGVPFVMLPRRSQTAK